jgi:tetratricopeptide (TPR) repeat protein
MLVTTSKSKVIGFVVSVVFITAICAVAQPQFDPSSIGTNKKDGGQTAADKKELNGINDLSRRIGSEKPKDEKKEPRPSDSPGESSNSDSNSASDSSSSGFSSSSSFGDDSNRGAFWRRLRERRERKQEEKANRLSLRQHELATRQYDLATQAYQNHDYSGAIEYIEQALVSAPDNPMWRSDLLHARALQFYESGDLQMAIRYLEEAVRVNPNASGAREDLRSIRERAATVEVNAQQDTEAKRRMATILNQARIDSVYSGPVGVREAASNGLGFMDLRGGATRQNSTQVNGVTALEFALTLPMLTLPEKERQQANLVKSERYFHPDGVKVRDAVKTVAASCAVSPHSKSHCTWFVASVAKQLGIPYVRNLEPGNPPHYVADKGNRTSNDDVWPTMNKFSSSLGSGWVKIDALEAQQRANDGFFVFGVWKNLSGPGHVMLAAPQDSKHQTSCPYGPCRHDIPFVFDQNHNLEGSVGINNAFGSEKRKQFQVNPPVWYVYVGPPAKVDK